MSDFSEVETRLICDSILSPYEQAEIEQAALLAHLGHHFEAERCRRFAGYDRRQCAKLRAIPPTQGGHNTHA